MAGGDLKFVSKILYFGGDFGQSQCGGIFVDIELLMLWIFKNCNKNTKSKDLLGNLISTLLNH